jgi:hypothetical protein
MEVHHSVESNHGYSMFIPFHPRRLSLLSTLSAGMLFHHDLSLFLYRGVPLGVIECVIKEDVLLFIHTSSALFAHTFHA